MTAIEVKTEGTSISVTIGGITGTATLPTDCTCKAIKPSVVVAGTGPRVDSITFDGVFHTSTDCPHKFTAANAN